MGKRKRSVLNDANDGRQEQSVSRRKMSDTLIDDANALSYEEFKRQYWSKFSSDGTLQLKFAANMTIGELEQCLQLVKHTSEADYRASSWGWYPTRKRKEMREKEMRYVILRESSSDESGSAPMQGFMSFMLTHDSTPAVPVLYVYEIHLTEDARGKGLGKKLMHVARDIATEVGVDKVMLTCFLSNTAALEFYRRLGFEKDVCSPEDRRTRRKTVKVDYLIMSSKVEPRSGHTGRRSTLPSQSTVVPKVSRVLPAEAPLPRTDALRPDSRLSADIPPSLRNCPATIRQLHVEFKRQDLISRSLTSTISALRDLSTNSDTRKAHRSVASCQAALRLHLSFIEHSADHAQSLLDLLMTHSQFLESAIRRVDSRLAAQMSMQESVAREAVQGRRQRKELGQLAQPQNVRTYASSEGHVATAEEDEPDYAGERDHQEEEERQQQRPIKLELVDGRPAGPKFGAGELLEKWFKTTIKAGAFRDIIKTEPVED